MPMNNVKYSKMYARTHINSYTWKREVLHRRMVSWYIAVELIAILVPLNRV